MVFRVTRGERPQEYPQISAEKALRIGGLLGLTPSHLAGGNSQPLTEAAKALQPESPRPDFEADAEFIERELFIPENRGAI